MTIRQQKIAALRAKGESTEVLVKESKAKEREFLSNQKLDESSKAWKAGKTEEQLAAANEAIRLNSKNWGAYNMRGVAYIDKSAYDKALADCNRALAINPNIAIAYNNRGTAYADMNDKPNPPAMLGRIE